VDVGYVGAEWFHMECYGRQWSRGILVEPAAKASDLRMNTRTNGGQKAA